MSLRDKIKVLAVQNKISVAELAEDNLTTIKAGKDISFKDYFESWYQTYKAPKLSDVTLARYKIIARVIDKEFNTDGRKSCDFNHGMDSPSLR